MRHLVHHKEVRAMANNSIIIIAVHSPKDAMGRRNQCSAIFNGQCCQLPVLDNKKPAP
jgi:hypothetical protein